MVVVAIYGCSRNAVEIPFEISRQIPQTITIYEQVDLKWMRERVRKNPLATLKELSTIIQQQFEVTPSVTHMDRILRLAGISRIPGSRAKQITA